MKLFKYLAILCIILTISATTAFADNIAVKTEVENINSTNSAGTIITLIADIENSNNMSDNIWKDFSDGLSLKNSKNYLGAIDKLESVAPVLLKQDDLINMAILFRNLGECYAGLTEYDYAASCWNREAYYWNKVGKVQSAIAANRKAEYIESEITLYAKTADKTKSQVKKFGAPLEPSIGLLLGVYAECDKGVHDPSSMKKFYMNEFPKLVGKDHAAYLLYFTYGMDLSVYQSHINVAKSKGKVIELALQPLKGLDSVNGTDGYIVKLAKEMQKSGVKFMLRFANEMNDPGNPWYTADYNKYIEKFRTVSTIFKKYAPSVAIVWAPNFYPPDTITKYYPGDKYVDYVGVSSYQNYEPELDPLKLGVDRGRWSSQLDYIYSIYGDKKPIIISECGSPYTNSMTGSDITSYAAKQLRDFYTYLPMRYPNVKAVFLFDGWNGKANYELSQNKVMLKTYKQVIQNKYYLSNYKDASKINSYYYTVSNNKISSKVYELNAYVKYAEDSKIARVEYKVNNRVIGNANEIPYKINFNFSKYRRKNVTITINVYDSGNKLLLTKTVKCMVE